MTDKKTPGLTLGELHHSLGILLQAGTLPETEVTVRFLDGEEQVGGILGRPVLEHAHDEDNTLYVALDCATEDETFEDFEDEEELEAT